MCSYMNYTANIVLYIDEENNVAVQYCLTPKNGAVDKVLPIHSPPLSIHQHAACYYPCLRHTFALPFNPKTNEKANLITDDCTDKCNGILF